MIKIPYTPVPFGVLFTIMGIICSIIIFFTARRSRAPRYHLIFVFLAFVMSIVWIYLEANELVGLLQSVGLMWNISDGILVVTVLTWGNSVGDMFADVVVARAGFPDMVLIFIPSLS